MFLIFCVLTKIHYICTFGLNKQVNIFDLITSQHLNDAIVLVRVATAPRVSLTNKLLLHAASGNSSVSSPPPLFLSFFVLIAPM